MELPGFYFDPIRNRYFPLQSRLQPTSAVNPQPQRPQALHEHQSRQIAQHSSGTFLVQNASYEKTSPSHCSHTIHGPPTESGCTFSRRARKNTVSGRRNSSSAITKRSVRCAEQSVAAVSKRSRKGVVVKSLGAGIGESASDGCPEFHKCGSLCSAPHKVVSTANLHLLLRMLRRGSRGYHLPGIDRFFLRLQEDSQISDPATVNMRNRMVGAYPAFAKRWARARLLKHVLLPLDISYMPTVCLAAAVSPARNMCVPLGSGLPTPSKHWHFFFSLAGASGGQQLQVFAEGFPQTGDLYAVLPRRSTSLEADGSDHMNSVQSYGTTLSSRYRGVDNSFQVEVDREDVGDEEQPHVHVGLSSLAGRVVDVHHRPPYVCYAVQSNGAAAGAVGVSRLGDRANSFLWYKEWAASDVAACAVNLSFSNVCPLNSKINSVAVAGRNPSVQLLAASDDDHTFQQQWTPSVRARRHLPQSCCSCEWLVSESRCTSPKQSDVALFGSTRGELLAIDARCALPISLITQAEQRALFTADGHPLSHIAPLKKYSSAIIARWGLGSTCLVDLRMVGKSSCCEDLFYLPPCVVRQYKPSLGRRVAASWYSSSRWRFAFDDKEELLLTPYSYTGRTSGRIPSCGLSGSFFVFDVYSGTCCREIKADAWAAHDTLASRRFELFGCCVFLPQVDSFTFGSQLRIAINSLNGQGFALPDHHAQNSYLCGCVADGRSNVSRLQNLYLWKCEFGSLDLRPQSIPGDVRRATCALLHASRIINRHASTTGGLQVSQSTGELDNFATKPCDEATSEMGPVFLGASTRGLHLISSVLPDAS